MKFLFRKFSYLDVINFKIFLESTSKAMTDREKKEGKANI